MSIKQATEPYTVGFASLEKVLPIEQVTIFDVWRILRPKRTMLTIWICGDGDRKVA